VLVAMGIALGSAGSRGASAASPTGEPALIDERGPSAEAEAGYVRGLAHYAARDFHRAIAEFEAAFALDPRPELLFAEAQAFRLDGDCPRALELYRRFLATRPPPLQVQATQLGLDRCAESASTNAASGGVAAASSVPPSATIEASGHPISHGPTNLGHLPPGPASTSASALRSLTDQRRPSAPPSAMARLAHDPWTVVPLSVALAAFGTGVGAWVASNRAQPAETPGPNTSYDDFSRAWQTAGARRDVAIGALSTAAVLGVVGGVRAWWLLRARHAPPPGRPAAAPAVDARLLFDGRWLTLVGSY
jgi:tetratricopeptide (TPR) repeat protein